MKIDPSKDSWGDIQIEINSEQATTSHVTTSSNYGGYTGTGSFGSTTSSYSNYVPMGGSLGDRSWQDGDDQI